MPDQARIHGAIRVYGKKLASKRASEPKSLKDGVVHKSDSKRCGYTEDTREERSGAFLSVQSGQTL